MKNKNEMPIIENNNEEIKPEEVEEIKNNLESETAEQSIEKIELDEENPKEKEAEIQKVRERIKDAPDKNQEDNNEQQQAEAQGQYSGEELFEKAREEKGGVEKAVRSSIVGNISEKISNTDQSQEARDKTAERKVPEAIRALEEVYGNLENIKEKVGTIMDIGAGWGENLRDLAEKLGAEKAIGVDSNTIYSEKVNKELGDKLAWLKRDAMEVMELLKAGVVDVSSAFALLQVLSEEEKIEMLKEIGRVTKEAIIIVDELKRDGFDGLKDLFMNKLYNAGMGKYKVLSEDGWKEIFKKAGLVVETFNKFGDNDFVAVLKKAEKINGVEQF